MAIIFKFALKSIIEKKFRTFLIIFSILMSSALFFASFSMSGTVEKMIVERIKKSTGSAEIMIYPGEKSSSNSVSDRGAMKIKNQTDYIIETVQGSALYKISDTKDLNVNLNGNDVGDYITLNTKTGKRDYKIIGLCETINYNGQAAFISDKYFKKDMEARYYNDILVKSNEDIDQTVLNVLERFRDRGIRLTTVADMEKTNVGVDAIQQVLVAIKHYNVNKGIVVTNSSFTNSAYELASSNGIELWDRTKLIEVIDNSKV